MTATLQQSVAANEAWMRGLLHVVEPDLAAKHAAMAKSPFAFLRATCFRFAETLPALVPELLRATAVPSVGDAHLENFGTWRDNEGRLIWGVNDLDEAALLPWPVDLLRLAASALLTETPPRARDVAEALLQGHAVRLAAPRPFVLDAENALLREAANPTPKERVRFWEKLHALEPAEPPRDMAAELRKSLPESSRTITFAPRVAGLGSLGRPRFVAMAEWRGGPVAREAKARLPSAYIYARMAGAAALDPVALAASPARAPDPWFRATPGLVLRRLAPDSRKIEAGGAVRLTDLLLAMGGELANIHAQGDGAALLEQKQVLPDGWLHDGARRLADAVRADHAAWR
ncbi:MAG: hypothetical protein JWR10_1873 [Rubritepida sp.]|nr:hypothetical protein [Rubritepida sp.]